MLDEINEALESGEVDHVAFTLLKHSNSDELTRRANREGKDMTLATFLKLIDDLDMQVEAVRL